MNPLAWIRVWRMKYECKSRRFFIAVSAIIRRFLSFGLGLASRNRVHS